MNPLQTFMAELLEQEGALVEVIEPEGLEILAPPALQQSLKLPELARLGFGATLPPDAQRISLESDWMERLAGLLDDKGRWSQQVLKIDNTTPGSPERVLQHTLELVNATYRLQDVSPAWTRYWLLQFRYTALSDERRDGLLTLGFNLASGATLDGLQEALLDALENLQPADKQSGLPVVSLPEPWPRERLIDILERALPARVAQRLQPFLNSMQRRQARDLERLYDYHNDLRQQALARLATLPAQKSKNEKQQAEREREEQRLAAIGREHQVKIEDLRHKYAMQIEIEWIQTLELVMPVQRFTVLIKRRKGERLMPLDWNPLARKLEQAPCELSYTWERPRLVLDDTLQLVSPDIGDSRGRGKAH